MIEKDFDKWNEIKKKTNESKRAPVKAGEIYWCKLGTNIGVEQDGKGEDGQRPVIIIKKFSNEIILGAPLTTKKHIGDWYFEIDFAKNKSYVILNQTRPVDTKRMISSMGQLSENQLKKIIDAYCKLIKS